MRSHATPFAVLMMAPIASVMLGAGCPLTEPPSEAMLAGDWQTVDQDGMPAFARFDENGVLQAILTIGENGVPVLIQIDGAVSTVEGADVTIVIPAPLGTATFQGTLSEDENSITGTVDRSIEIGDDITVVIPQGNLELNRLEDTSCALVVCEAGETCVDGACVPADSDGDGVVDGEDGCPDDADKTEPGVCDCGTPDDDTDTDGVADCDDNCPDDANADQADADTDGIGDVCDDDAGS